MLESRSRGARGFLSTDWLNLEQDVMRQPAEEQCSPVVPLPRQDKGEHANAAAAVTTQQLWLP